MNHATEKETVSKREEKILHFWKKQDIFKKSLELRKKGKLFAFYDGPPFATGLPHYGHLLAGTIKDVIPRFKTMQGYYVPRRFGWDCHGLPVENEIEKSKELSGAPEIEKFGIANFNEECRSIVLRYTSEWQKTVERMGRLIDFENTYKTMNITFMESVWWVFGQLWEKGLVYEGFKVMPFSAKLGTPLSNFEANLNYRDVQDPSLTVMFPVKGEVDTYFLAWTTTPWTLPSNLALTVGPEILYVKVEHEGKFYILAEARVEAHFKEKLPVVQKMTGKELAGIEYEPLFHYFDGWKNAFCVLVDDFVTTEDGTGVVQTAPAFGEQDYFVCKREGIEPVCPVDSNGRFTKEIPEYAGLFVKDADSKIMRHLKAEGRVFSQSQISHRYPFCWRSDTPLIYKAVSSWFVAVEQFKDKMIVANQKIHWVPDHIKEGRFGKWLEGARDWAISRNRYWGTPIPIWRSESGKCIVITSVAELEKRTGEKITDLHRHHIDALIFEEGGEKYTRIHEVFDCWFESGSMPYAQNHFPFENEKETMEAFPADFIAEGLDQTRGWFYTLTALAAALYDKPAFKNVIVNGIILAEDGNKMSKRLKNYPEPTEVIDQYGADAIRLYLLNSPAVQGGDLRFSGKGVELISRQILIPLWNAYVFFVTYARIYNWTPKPVEPTHVLDRWILSRLSTLIQDVTTALEAYQLSQAIEPFLLFVDELTNWYIRRSRPRFWADEESFDRDSAFATLHRTLLEVSKVAAPFVPFITDSIYQSMREEKDPISVHLCDYPKPTFRDEKLEEEMGAVKNLVRMGHALRKEHKLRVRQPLQSARVISIKEGLEKYTDIICDELNVKEVIFSSDEGGVVQTVAKPNFRTLGRKVGKKMRAVQEAIANLSPSQMEEAQKGTLVLKVEDEEIAFDSEDVLVEKKIVGEGVAATEQEMTIVLDTKLSEELILEGFAREIVNKLNTMRRDASLEVTDRIRVQMDLTPKVEQAYHKHAAYIQGEALATDVTLGPCTGTRWDLGGEEATISIEKV